MKVSVRVAPTVSTTTAIRVMGVMTLRFAMPVIVPDVALIWAVPSPIADTWPAVSTVATAGAVVDQVNEVMPGIGLPRPSTALAVKL